MTVSSFAFRFERRRVFHCKNGHLFLPRRRHECFLQQSLIRTLRPISCAQYMLRRGRNMRWDKFVLKFERIDLSWWVYGQDI